MRHRLLAACAALLAGAALHAQPPLRSAGVPPYHVLVTMTTIVRRAAHDPEPLPDPDTITADVIEWSLATSYSG